MRPIKKILETQKSCKPGESAKEIIELAYKMRNNLQLTEDELKLRDAYFKTFKQ